MTINHKASSKRIIKETVFFFFNLSHRDQPPNLYGSDFHGRHFTQNLADSANKL